MGLTVTGGKLVLRSSLLGTGTACCCVKGVESCVPGCSLPESLQVTLLLGDVISGSASPSDISATDDLFNGTYTLAFSSFSTAPVYLEQSALYETTVFGTGDNLFALWWHCGSEYDGFNEMTIQQCDPSLSTNYSGAYAFTDFFGTKINVIFLADMLSQESWCASPQTSTTFNSAMAFLARSNPSGCFGTEMFQRELSVTVDF